VTACTGCYLRASRWLLTSATWGALQASWWTVNQATGFRQIKQQINKVVTGKCLHKCMQTNHLELPLTHWAHI
jgi:hypothetical protein